MIVIVGLDLAGTINMVISTDECISHSTMSIRESNRSPANSRCCRIRAKVGLRPLGRELPPTSLDGVCSDAVTCERTRALGVYLGHLVKQQGPERRHQAGRYVMLHAWFLKT